MSSAVAIGVDIGGTKLVAARIAADGEVLERTRITTPAGSVTELLAAVVRIIEELEGAALPVGVGIAGIIDPTGTVVYGPNIGVTDLALSEELDRRLDTSITVKNDASVALWGEIRAGSATGAEHAVMLTIGTGVGGAVAIDGRLLEGAKGFAGELGHIIVEEGGRPCPCGNDGCLEAYSSGTAIELRARARLTDRSVDSSLRAIERLTGKDVAEAAIDGDDFAVEVLEEAGEWLGVGMASLANVLDPELFVVGGGATTRSGPFMLPPAREWMADRLLGSGYRTPPRVVEATLGDDAGMIGAGLLAAAEA